jgi:hypothetical protein
MRKIALAAALSSVIWMWAQDRLAVDPRMTIFFENDRVRVQEHRLKPGERVGMHSHPDSIIVVMNNSRFRMVVSDGRKLEGENKMGQAIWLPALSHSVENIGGTEIRNIVIELKGRTR